MKRINAVKSQLEVKSCQSRLVTTVALIKLLNKNKLYKKTRKWLVVVVVISLIKKPKITYFLAHVDPIIQ